MNKVNKIVLNNGLTLIHSQIDRAPVAALVAWVKSGSAAEEENEYGIAHMCEHMVFKGTARRGVGQISEEAEKAGGDINAWTSYDETVFYLTLPVAEADLGMDLLADMVQNPTISPEELEREKEVILEEYRRGLDTPRQKISNEIFRLSYAGHPYGHNIIGTEESIKAQTSQSLHNFIAKHYLPQNMVLTIVGQLSKKEALKLAEKYWGAWQPPEIATVHGADPAARAATPAETTVKIMTEKLEECQLVLSWPLPDFDNDDIPAIDLLDTIMGGSASSKLVTTLRDKLNLVNNCDVYAFTPRGQGMMLLSASLDSANLLPTLKTIVSEIQALMSQEVSAAELEKARFILQSASWRKMETAEGLARDFANFEMMAENPHYDYIYNSLLDEVTPAKICQIARKYLQKPAAAAVMLSEKDTAPKAEEITNILAQLKQPAAAAASAARQDEHGWYHYDLPGGGHIVAQVDRSAPLVACQFAYNGGQRYEQKGECGIEAFLATMLTFSTKKHSYAEITTRFDELAAGVYGAAGRNSINLVGTFLAKNFLEGLPLFLECLWQPAFKRQDIALVRRLVLEKIRTKSDHPARQAAEAMLKGLYGDHPLGAPQIGLPEDVKAINKRALEARHKKVILENSPYIAIVGDFDPEIVCPLIIAEYTRQCGSHKPLPAIPEVTTLTAPADIHIPASKEQVHIKLGFLGPAMYDSTERWSLSLLFSAIGGMSGRLFTELRDKESLCYTVSGSYVPGPTSGYLSFYIATAPEKVQQARDGLCRELQKIITSGITQDELDKARRAILGENLINMQYTEIRASEISLDGLYNLPYDSYLMLSEELQKITIADIQKAAAKYLVMERAVWAMVGDAK